MKILILLPIFFAFNLSTKSKIEVLEELCDKNLAIIKELKRKGVISERKIKNLLNSNFHSKQLQELRAGLCIREEMLDKRIDEIKKAKKSVCIEKSSDLIWDLKIYTDIVQEHFPIRDRKDGLGVFVKDWQKAKLITHVRKRGREFCLERKKPKPPNEPLPMPPWNLETYLRSYSLLWGNN